MNNGKAIKQKKMSKYSINTSCYGFWGLTVHFQAELRGNKMTILFSFKKTCKITLGSFLGSLIIIIHPEAFKILPNRFNERNLKNIIMSVSIFMFGEVRHFKPG